MERYRSGQPGQTVNLLAFAYGGSNPPLSTNSAHNVLKTLVKVLIIMSGFRLVERDRQQEKGSKQVKVFELPANFG